jgi:ABC-type maltose transport system permease subunit
VAARQIDLYDKQRRLAWYLIIPAVLVVVLVIGYPLAQVVVYSFLKYKLDGVTPASFVGLENYAFVLSDPDWWRAVWNTLIFTFFSVTLEQFSVWSWRWWQTRSSRAGPFPYCHSDPLGHPHSRRRDLEMDVQ